jgi:hypothetical protein
MIKSLWLRLDRKALNFTLFCFCSVFLIDASYAQEPNAFQTNQSAIPSPLFNKGHSVDWWFVFKFNAKSFPGCGQNMDRVCAFGGEAQKYKASFSQQFVFASSENPTLKKGDGCVGDNVTDPLGATFDQVYNNDDYFYVIWNDQFYDDPKIQGCTKECGAPWGHSKGMVAWNKAGEGFVLQVSTPSWPASGNRKFSRKSDGDTLGCVIDDNVEVSQHFFSLKLTKTDLLNVLNALQNASVVTDPKNSQIVKNGGPDDVQSLVKQLGHKSKSTDIQRSLLSTGVEVISKPSSLNVPPWQLISATLDGVPLKAATWWASPQIPSTDATTPISCWKDELGTPGAIQIATSGQWDNQIFGLTGGGGPDHNHAKIGISTDPNKSISIFGDMNQQGTLSNDAVHKCSSSQNGRGGLFYIVKDAKLFQGLTSLLQGDTATVSQGPSE